MVFYGTFFCKNVQKIMKRSLLCKQSCKALPLPPGFDDSDQDKVRGDAELIDVEKDTAFDTSYWGGRVKQ